jgi:multisubunit Na+/H+ antiporter MnhE subunit
MLLLNVALVDLLFIKVIMVARRHIMRKLYFVNFVHVCGHGIFISNVDIAVYPNVTDHGIFFKESLL